MVIFERFFKLHYCIFNKKKNNNKMSTFQNSIYILYRIVITIAVINSDEFYIIIIG